MAKSKASKHIGSVLGIGGALIAGIAVLGVLYFAFSERGRLQEKLEEKVFGHASSSDNSSSSDNASSSDTSSSSDSAVPDTSNGLTYQQPPQYKPPQYKPPQYKPPQYKPQYQQPPPQQQKPKPVFSFAFSKPLFSTALANYYKMIHDATNSNFSGFPSQDSPATVTKNNSQSSSSSGANKTTSSYVDKRGKVRNLTLASAQKLNQRGFGLTSVSQPGSIPTNNSTKITVTSPESKRILSAYRNYRQNNRTRFR